MRTDIERFGSPKRRRRKENVDERLLDRGSIRLDVMKQATKQRNTVNAEDLKI